MKKKKLLFIQRPYSKGQSFVEMTFVMGILVLLLVGMLEIGYLLNRYSILVDAVRSGARYGSSGKTDPYVRTVLPFGLNSNFFPEVSKIIGGQYEAGDAGALDPIILDEDVDDVIITFYRVVDGETEETFGPWHRFPIAGAATGNAVPKITEAIVEASLTSAAPDSGVLVIEIFYAHQQLLKFPIFSSFVPDPMEVHTYAIMPLSMAKPTPVP